MNSTPAAQDSFDTKSPRMEEESEDQKESQAEVAGGPQEPAKNRLPDIPVSQVRHVKSQAELDEVLESHRQWIAQVLDPDVEIAAGRANLAGVDLRGLSLVEANLSGANLAKANLTEVDLTRANLTATNLTGAMLACANLSGAKLRGAKLEGADLRGADLTGAHLQGADLSRSLLKSPETTQAQDPEPETLASAVAAEVTPQPEAAPLEVHFGSSEL